MILHRVAPLLLLIVPLSAGCPRREAPRQADLAQPAKPPGKEPAKEIDAGLPAGALPPQEQVRPVYPAALQGTPDPLVARVCAVLHQVPETRRAACCQAPQGTVLTDECLRTLNAAVGAGAIRLSAAEIDACEQETAKALSGCDWVGAWPPPLPSACAGLLHGTLALGAACRSSLECAGALRCQGAGPTQVGKCEPALEAGSPCGRTVDALAPFTRQGQVDRQHPECAGSCDRRHLCMEKVATGGPCVTSAQCGAGARCAAGRCVAGAEAAAGEACTGDDCAPGLRCYKGKCLVPGREGARCDSDFECQGGCLKDGAKGPGRCGAKCTAR
jgi:hypothetical protein